MYLLLHSDISAQGIRVPLSVFIYLTLKFVFLLLEFPARGRARAVEAVY